MKRREFIKHVLVSGAMGLFTGASYAARPTPAEIEGPFYPVLAQKDKDFDLTSIQGQPGVARGKIIIIQGRVLDTEGKPVEDATVDLWQANAAGRYSHPHDSNKAPLDPNFQGWAIVPSGKDGRFRFKTVYPGFYPASDTWVRPPHIHFKISKRGYVELVTQMYFPGNKLNDLDVLLGRKSKDERGLMIADRVGGEPETYEYDVVLERAGE
ncbi:MAG: protocatechuate 3,4-dioxygenase [Gallionella sp.]